MWNGTLLISIRSMPTPTPRADETPVLGPAPTGGAEFQAARTLTDAETKPPTFPPGTRLGPYEVLRELGRGSMGTVVAARHAELGREAALKVLSGTLVADPAAVERFRRESEAVAQLEHPGIVRLYDRGEAKGAHWFAMELVAGSSLEQLIRRERLAYSEAARIMAQAAHAIDYAHSRGVLHRDLKPANILLDQSGRARVMDFGLARLDSKATLTSDGIVVGTPLYLAPEVARGERASRRSDIYSLGASLYELATGKPPYEGREARDVMNRVANEAPIPPTDADPRVPRDLVRIIAKAMARDPEERYANARALGLDLERFVEGRSLELSGGASAFRETKASLAWKRFLFHGTIVLGVAGAFGAILWLRLQLKEAKDEVRRLTKELEKAKTRGPVEPPPGLELDRDGVRAAQDRDVRGRIALRGLPADATFEGAPKSFDDLLAAAHAEPRGSAVAAARLRQALQLSPRRWDVRLELAAALADTALDDAEAECTLCVLAAEAPRDLQLAARLLRARVYRARGDAVALWLAASDLKVVVPGRPADAEGQAVAIADLAFALAATGDPKSAEATLRAANPTTPDELARVALARAAIARARGETAVLDVELGRAKETASTDETRRLVDAFASR